MSTSSENSRVLLAITEASPVDALWRAALQRLGKEGTELTAIYVSEDHWQRAASLPFTREISRVSGTYADFNLRRAIQVHEEAIARVRNLVSRLASEAKLKTAFEVLTPTDVLRARQLLQGAGSVLIAPSLLRRRPILAEFEKLGCRIEFVEVAGNGREKPAELEP